MLLERSRCRAATPAYRVTIDRRGHVVYLGEANAVVGRYEADVSVSAVERLVARARKAGFAGWTDTLCEPTASSSCSMHPCFTHLAIADGGATHRVSTASDAPASPAFAALVLEVERTSQSWRWADDGVEPGMAEPCATDIDCRMELDACGALHAILRSSRAPRGCRVGNPNGGVVPKCLASRCVLSPLSP